MSPPCQPFTTTVDAKQRDLQDPRNRAFLHLMNCLKQMRNGPEWIFFENVVGFWKSETYNSWIDALRQAGYAWRHYCLTPVQFRIPNNRMRFYMVIKKASHGIPKGFHQETDSPLYRDIRKCRCTRPFCMQVNGNLLDLSNYSRTDVASNQLHEIVEDGAAGPRECHPIGAFVLDDADLDVERNLLVVPDKYLEKSWACGLSYVGGKDKSSFCFTSAYPKTFHKASGSLYHTKCAYGSNVELAPDMSTAHSDLVRRFSPRELLNLFCFPPDFHHPRGMPLATCLRTVGQSVNVAVVTALMHSELCISTSSSSEGANGN